MDDNFFDEEDLVVTSTSNRNWKGIIIAVLVIASILSLIVTAVVLLTPPDEGPRVKGRRFELDDVFGPQFQPYTSNGSWLSDTEWVFRDMNGGASILNVKNGTTISIVNSVTFDSCNGVSFTLSADRKYALLVHDVQKTHRFSFKAKYTIYEIETKSAIPLSIEDEKKHSELQLVKWSPVGNSLVMVHENDIYFKMGANEKTTNRLTDTAQSGTIYNGVPDWLYEEEILESNSALWFSNDGQRLLYLTFNDSLVKEHHILQYGSIGSSNPNPNLEEFTYPKIKTLRYPKPGMNNPVVIMKVVDLWKPGRFYQKQFRAPEDISSRDHYVTSAGWINATDIGVVWTSRSYHLSLISICSALSGSCQEEYRITTEKRGWVGNIPFPIFTTLPNSTNFITTAPIRDGENGFFDHLVLVDTGNKRSHPITHGSYDVIKINAWDEQRKLVYFIATPSNHPNERHLYSVKVGLPYTEHLADCISCTFSEGNNTSPISTDSIRPKADRTTGDTQTMYSPDIHLVGVTRTLKKNQNLTKAKQKEEAKERENAEKANPPFSTQSVTSLLGRNSTCTFVTNVRFSKAHNFFMLECGGPNIPYEASYTLADYPISAVRLIQILQPNSALVNLSRGMAFPQVRIFPVHLHSGTHTQVRLLLPPGLREDEITQYPMIINVYGAPGSQLAVDKWGVDFATYFASKKDYIVAQIDGRGSGGRGWNYKHQVYYNLGYLETHDQIEVVRHLRDSLPYVETNKIGIWGWSYGGYLTASIMTSRDTSDLFQCGASIAPVAKWDLHDSTYSEKYMGTPNVTDNYKGYAHSDLTRNVESLAKKAFYLIHGTADEDVHVQHSMLLARALIDKKILFRQQIYPDEPHTLSGAKIHVHRSLEEFFEDCFKKQIAPEVDSTLNKGGKFDDFD